VRELIEAVRYAPSPGKHRIFVVDEVHMLSTAAFNALLKTLEEPPPRSLFVFATTNPEKIPFTVLSRCQRHDLRRIAAAEIVARLELICRDEEIEVSAASLLAIAREADGSLRDAQTLLDQIIAFGGTRVDDEQVAQVLDLIDRRLLLAILAACVDGDGGAALEACARAAEAGADAKRLGENLLQLLRDLVVLRIAPHSDGLVEASDAERAELSELAGRTDEGRLRRMFRALVKEQEDLAWAPQPHAVLEMAVVRLATMPAGDDVARLLTRLETLERRLADGGPAGGDSSPAGGETRPGASKLSGGDPPSTHPQAAPAAEAERPRAAAAAGPAPAPGDPSAPLAVVFDRLRAFAAGENPHLAAAFEGGRLLERSDDRLRVAAPNRFAAQRLSSRRDALEQLCARFFGHPIRVAIETQESGGGGSDPETDPETLRRLRQKALNHPAVGHALDVLEGEVVEIQPLGGGGAPR
jgi:DNA polymerase-3 subunit gamma/tau